MYRKAIGIFVPIAFLVKYFHKKREKGKNKMKVKNSLCLFLCIIFLCGCNADSYYTLQSVEKNTKTQMAMSYKKFSGQKQTTLKVNEGENLVIKGSVVSEEGSLNVFIKNKDDDAMDYVFQQNDIPTSDFIIKITESGKYVLCVKGENHKGSYVFDWSSNNIVDK